jgi:glycosyltransferase involved in cell wall biosynthesis
MNNLVSVIVPVYNRAHLIAETVDSILLQTYPDFEIILINDGSNDNSLSVIKEYQKRFPEKIRVIDQENQGQIVARNNGIKEAQGEYIAFLDSDDIWLKEKLEWQLKLFEAGVGLVYSGTEVIDEKGETLRTEPADAAITGNIYAPLLLKNRMTGGTVVVTAEALNNVGVFSTDFKAAENWDLWYGCEYAKPTQIITTAVACITLQKVSTEMLEKNFLPCWIFPLFTKTPGFAFCEACYAIRATDCCAQ